MSNIQSRLLGPKLAAILVLQLLKKGLPLPLDEEKKEIYIQQVISYGVIQIRKTIKNLMAF